MTTVGHPINAYPTKYVSAGALIFDEDGGLLIVKPTYKNGWEIPGGIVELDESPMQGCLREVREELGIEVSLGQLLVVDHKPRHGGLPGSLQFIFSGGILRPPLIEAIRLPPSELLEYRFMAPEVALRLLQEPVSRRVEAALRAMSEGRTSTLHDGSLE